MIVVAREMQLHCRVWIQRQQRVVVAVSTPHIEHAAVLRQGAGVDLIEEVVQSMKVQHFLGVVRNVAKILWPVMMSHIIMMRHSAGLISRL